MKKPEWQHWSQSSLFNVISLDVFSLKVKLGVLTPTSPLHRVWAKHNPIKKCIRDEILNLGGRSLKHGFML